VYLTPYLPPYPLSGKTTSAMTIGESHVEAFCGTEYDYVIVGGGTAGLVLAARLSENGSINVGVLEAGELKQDDPSISTPLLCSSIQGDPSYDWMFKTVPQVHPLLLCCFTMSFTFALPPLAEEH
jgi:choline dehydrogenase-like flavoprotein